MLVVATGFFMSVVGQGKGRRSQVGKCKGGSKKRAVSKSDGLRTETKGEIKKECGVESK